MPICESLTLDCEPDDPCPDCGHRVGSHAVADGGGTCDVCDIIRAVTDAAS